MAKVKDIAGSKAAAPAVKEDPIAYITVFELRDIYGELSLPIKTPNDILAISNQQEWFKGITQKFSEAVIAQAKVPEGATEAEKNQILDKKANELILTDSGVKKSDIELFTAAELAAAISNIGLKNSRVAFLAKWAVKPE